MTAGRVSAALSCEQPRPSWVSGRWTWMRIPDRRLLALAVALQIALAAIPLHRSYDRTAFEAAGYLVGTGRSPYVLHDLSAVFHSAQFGVFDTIGYPPPWPLLLGGIYRLTYGLIPSLDVYAFAIKLPLIAAAVALACLAGAAVQNLGAAPETVRRVWLALLFNPFLIYVAAVRGQIDTIVALVALAALLLVACGRRDLSAVTLALAVCFKPTAAPLLLAVLLVLAATSARQALRYLVLFTAGILGFYALPFVLLGWDASPVRNANAQLALSGAMSPSSIAGLWVDQTSLTGHWWLLGLVWLPALAIAVLVARRGPRDFTGLLALGLTLTLVFFLARPWLSETNVALLLAPAIVLVALGRLDRRLYVALWALPLLMTLTYLWPVKLLWALTPGVVAQAAFWAERSSGLVMALRVAVIVAWQVTGWWIVIACLRRGRVQAGQAGPRTRAAAPATGPEAAAQDGGAAS